MFICYVSSSLHNLYFCLFVPERGQGNGIYVSISKYGSDTPVTRPETDKAGLSSRDRKRGGGKLKCYWNFEYSWEAWVDY